MLKSLLIPALFIAAASTSQAQERVLTADKAAGYSTVVTQCVSFTRAEFANALCDDLLDRIGPMIRAEGLGLIALGRTEWGFGADEVQPKKSHKKKNGLTWHVHCVRTNTCTSL